MASMGLGRLVGSLNSKVNSASASTGAIFSMRSSALTRLCACLASGLGLEAVDELLQVGDFFLLLGKAGLLQLQLLCAQVFKLAVVAAVARDLGIVDVHRDIGHRVQEFAVVADDDHRALVTLEPGFEPYQCIQVQVIGGFVEQQQRSEERR